MFNQCNTSIPLSAIMNFSSKKTQKKNYAVLKDKARINPELTCIIYQSQAAIQSLEKEREKFYLVSLSLAWLPQYPH